MSVTSENLSPVLWFGPRGVLLRSTALVLFAVACSCLLGLTVSRSLSRTVLYELEPRAIRWILASHHLAWAGLLPLLVKFTKFGWAACADACAVAMAYGGIAVLGGTALNMGIYSLYAGGGHPFWTLVLFICGGYVLPEGLLLTFLFSHIVMAVTLVEIFRPAGVALWKLAACWLTGFVGSFVFLVWGLYPLTSEPVL